MPGVVLVFLDDKKLRRKYVETERRKEEDV